MTVIDATSLTAQLSPQPGPVLTWFSNPDEDEDQDFRQRVELSGPVARRWIAKTDNFLGSEFPFDLTKFVVDLPSHWRTPFWLITPWLRGAELGPVDHWDGVDMVISSNLGLLETLRDDEGIDMLVAQPLGSFALSWTGGLPFGITDGTADVSSYGDFVELPHTASEDSVMVSIPNWQEERHPEAPSSPLRLKGVLEVDFVHLPATEDKKDSLAGERVLLTTKDPTLASVQILQLWLRGASVVWVPGGADADKIAESEMVTQRGA